MLRSSSISLCAPINSFVRLLSCCHFSLEELKEASKALSDVLETDLPKMQKQIPDSKLAAASEACDRCGRVLHD